MWGDWTDERDKQSVLDIGESAARTSDRDKRESETLGTAGFEDIGFSTKPDTEQTGLVETEQSIDGQLDLFGGGATVSEGGEWDTDPDDVMLEYNLPENGATRVAMESQLPELDVTISPQEAFDGLAQDSFRDPPGFVYDDQIEEDTMAFVQAEEQRAQEQFGAGSVDSVGSLGRDTETVEFGSRAAAKEARGTLADEALVTDRFDGRHKSIEIDPAGLDDRQLDRVSGMAADSRAHEARQHGQIELLDSEKQRIDFSETSLFHAEAAKGILVESGVEDWTMFYDPTLGADEHRSLVEQARKDDRGQRLDEEATEAAEIGRMAQAHQTAQSQECDHARKGCKDGFDEACEVAREECDLSDKEIAKLRGQVERGEISRQEAKRRIDVEIERSRSSGRMVEPGAKRVPGKSVDRRTNSGRFVSRGRADAGVQRDVRTGKFVPEGDDA